MNQKLSLLSVHSMVQNRLDNILVVFRIDWGGLWGNSAWEENGIVLMSSFQATCVDLGMDLVFVWQLECVVRRIWLSFRDLKGADIARIKLCAPTFLLDAEA